WYDVDFPDVIALRRRVYADRHDYTMIGSSVTDPRWLDRISADRPVLVVAEGLVHYLAPDDGLALFRRIVEHFPSAPRILDAYNRWVIRLLRLVPAARATNVRLAWAIDDPHDLVRQIPRLALVSDVPFLTLPQLVAQLPHARSSVLRLVGRTRFVRHAIRHL